MAHAIFENTGIQVTILKTDRIWVLILALHADFVQSFVNDKVKEWSDELSRLSEIGLTQPHACHVFYPHSWAFGEVDFFVTHSAWNK